MNCLAFEPGKRPNINDLINQNQTELTNQNNTVNVQEFQQVNRIHLHTDMQHLTYPYSQGTSYNHRQQRF